MPMFDPYREWLDIDPADQPADHYRLLGLARFETDRERISRAADERMARLRQYQMGPRGIHTQKLLNELSAARLCLLDGQRKAVYDAELGARISADAAARRAAAPPGVKLVPPQPPPEPTISSPAGSSPSTERTTNWRLPLLILPLVVTALVAIGGLAIGRWRPAPDVENEPTSPVIPSVSSDASAAAAVRPSARGEIDFPGQDWSVEGDASWPFQVYRPGFFQAEITYGTDETFASGELVLQIDERPRRLSVRPTGGLAKLETEALILAVPRSGRHTLTVRLADAANTSKIFVHGVRFVPLEPGVAP